MLSGACEVFSSGFLVGVRWRHQALQPIYVCSLSGEIERYVNSRRFTLPPTCEAPHDSPLARRLVLNTVREFNGSPTAALCGFSRTLFAANGFPRLCGIRCASAWQADLSVATSTEADH